MVDFTQTLLKTAGPLVEKALVEVKSYRFSKITF